MQADAADQAGIFVALGGMADEAGRFINDQQVVVLINDGKQRIHTNNTSADASEKPSMAQCPAKHRWKD